MKSIHYAGDILLTGDHIADALVQYAQALASKDSSASIDIPVRFPDGRVEHASFLLGPASQLVAVPAQSDYDEVEDDEIIAKLRRRVDLLQDPRPRIDDTDDQNSVVLDDLEYPDVQGGSDMPR